MKYLRRNSPSRRSNDCVGETGRGKKKETGTRNHQEILVDGSMRGARSEIFGLRLFWVGDG